MPMTTRGPMSSFRTSAPSSTETTGSVARAETALADLRAGRTGRLSVRHFATAGSTLVAPALAGLREEHPGIRIDLELTDPADPFHEVAAGRADLAVVVRPRDHRTGDGDGKGGVRMVHLLHDPYAAVLPAGHPLAEQEALNLHELAGEQWVGSEPPGPASNRCSTPVRRRVSARMS